MLEGLRNRFNHNKVKPFAQDGEAQAPKSGDLRARLSNLINKFFAANTPFSTIWGIILFVIYTYNILVIPFRATFLQSSIWWIIVDVITDSLLLWDMLGGFFKPYRHSAKWVTDTKRTSRRYLKTWFLVDFLSRFPAYAFAAVVGGDVTDPRLRLNYLLLVTRVIGQFSVFEKFVKRVFVSLLRLVVTLLFVAHWLACGFVAISQYEGVDVSSSWTNSKTFFLPTIGVYYKYVLSMYWVLCTMTGFGGTQPSTDVEVYYNILTTIVGIGYYAVSISVAGDLISNRDPIATEFQERYDDIKDFLKMRKIPMDLNSRVNDYYEYLWRSRKGLDEVAILDELPAFLRAEVAMHLNRSIIDKVPIFKDSSANFLTEVVMNLKPRIALPESHVIRIGELGQEMFFISKGTVSIKTSGGLTVATLESGHFFGEIALLMGTLRSADVVATSYCDLFVMEKDDFDELLSYHPNEAEALVKISTERHQSSLRRVASDTGRANDSPTSSSTSLGEKKT
ncbi:cyclic nucleotide gated channel alpha [Acrasis kona]|uniref:Cyclic nucleotide gated channel alpha n=1 Tax=Acrasis kona TaxID=1008807 RepID=A0AAW2ZRY7_9EUKA